MKLGLRIDVDTYRGTRLGVPALCDLLGRAGVKATFFFSAGPDNMGRHLFRLLNPAFLLKMVRSNAPGLYGWDIILRGTLFPGPRIAERLAPVLRRAADEGHEIGLHAWDHHAWQARLHRMRAEEIRDHLRRAFEAVERACGRPPVCSAAPAWRVTDAALLEKDRFPFRYNSDCRGESVFLPRVAGKPLSVPQVPATLPTFDEIIGRDGVTRENYNERLLDLLRPDALNVLTVHAEVEGIACRDLFADFLEKAARRGVRLVPLGELLPPPGEPIPAGEIARGAVPGRAGWVSVQRAAAAE